MAKKETGQDSDSENGKSAGDIGGITKSFDQYEYIGVVIPGATLLFGLLLIWSEPFRASISKDFSLGSLGLFVIAAYVVGHIVRALGDLLEAVFWACFGGMPTDWAPDNKRHLLDDNQREALKLHLRSLLKKKDLTLEQYKDNRQEWRAIIREIYAAVARAKMSARVDVFNRTYGLMIGITMADIIIGLVLVVQVALCDAANLPVPERTAISIAIMAFVVAILTMHRAFLFGRSYARELFVQFLELPLK
jgi:hypothetical protein